MNKSKPQDLISDVIIKTLSDLQNPQSYFNVPKVGLQKGGLQKGGLQKGGSLDHFMLPPFEEGMPIPEELKQYYDIKDREVYDVITDFDKSPSELSNIQKQLRKKYLGIILSLMNQSNDMIKNIIAKNLNSMPTGSTSWEETQEPTPTRTTVLTQTITNDQTQDITMAPEGYQEEVNFLDNYEPLFNTIKRIINLLIMEIDLNTEIEIAPCNKKPYIITIGVLSVILVIMIFIGIMGIMGIIRFNK